MTIEDAASIAKNKGRRSTDASAVTDAAIAINDLPSAVFFAGLLLQRSSFRRRIIEATVGPEWGRINVGERYPVTDDEMGLDEVAFEVIEADLNMTSRDTTLRLASLE